MTAGAKVDSTLGAVLIGCFISNLLFGSAIYQFYEYIVDARKHEKDAPWTRILALTVISLSWIHLLLVDHSVYYYLVTMYDNTIKLDTVVSTLLLEVIVNGIIGCLVQSFLLYRVWYYMTVQRSSSSQNFMRAIITTIAIIFIFADCGCVTAFGIVSLIHVRTFSDLVQLKWLSILVNVLTAVGDVYISAALSFLLYRSKTGFERTDNMIRLLIVYTVGTGALTSLCAVGSLISITTAPSTFIYIGFFFCLGHLYANTLFATLNGRTSIVDSVDERRVGSNQIAASSVRFNNVNSSNNHAISVQIDTYRESDHSATKDGIVHDIEMADMGHGTASKQIIL
ncbi:hypothetical protein VNI00_017958 [Paramarasmius palmivorus]|uniref:DUF6534 domain-containing protein n=1 Tax=Paramarasmius palmivorus TaxID=297713 RepID=A0AAW0B4F4_9AGAR